MIHQILQKNIKYGQKSPQITFHTAHKPHVNVLPNSNNQGLKNERDDCYMLQALIIKLRMWKNPASCCQRIVDNVKCTTSDLQISEESRKQNCVLGKGGEKERGVWTPSILARKSEEGPLP